MALLALAVSWLLGSTPALADNLDTVEGRFQLVVSSLLVETPALPAAGCGRLLRPTRPSYSWMAISARRIVAAAPPGQEERPAWVRHSGRCAAIVGASSRSPRGHHLRAPATCPHLAGARHAITSTIGRLPEQACFPRRRQASPKQEGCRLSAGGAQAV